MRHTSLAIVLLSALLASAAQAIPWNIRFVAIGGGIGPPTWDLNSQYAHGTPFDFAADELTVGIGPRIGEWRLALGPKLREGFSTQSDLDANLWLPLYLTVCRDPAGTSRLRPRFDGYVGFGPLGGPEIPETYLSLGVGVHWPFWGFEPGVSASIRHVFPGSDYISLRATVNVGAWFDLGRRK